MRQLFQTYFTLLSVFTSVTHTSPSLTASLAISILATGASLIQPTLRHPAGPRAQLHDLNSSCVAVQIRVASIDSPIFRVEAWTLFYQVPQCKYSPQCKYVGR